MLIDNGDGTCTTGPLDIALILHDVTTDRFHVAFFHEAPMPGPLMPFDEIKSVRLKSNMHHAPGCDTFDEALEELDRFLAVYLVFPFNVLRDAPVDWDGEIGIVLLVPNWLLKGHERSLASVLLQNAPASSTG